ncbi:MAG: SxtJ family membrane protein [Alphaproteobacteria bacterium]|nr:SxtJ family membrane protein [Alphaproteobacteria bacterium]
MAKNLDFHEDFRRKEEVKGSSNRGFGIVFAVFFAILTFSPLTHGDEIRWKWFGIPAVAFLAAAYLFPKALTPLNWLWTRFGLLLHHVMNPLIMGLLFFLTVTPVGLVMRLAGKDPLRLKIDRGAKSYWIQRDPPGPEPDTMRRQF